ncbi:NAD(P)-binding domain protein [Niveomyces insectorum RCEF 264]|uniref:NAD(P)-binding domain protein n=1 Tax=Niveomyces insectorum RCEF 264 TaxID=1081102 RepID=A0A167NUA3_9HYPO|nr:NAD(P)-binding domain protein [Niveomyces insectorum RCEF 264]
MPPKSIDLGDKAITSLFPRTFIKTQFCTKTRLPPPGTDLSGQVALITGGNAGLGFCCARHLLGLKLARLVLAMRSPARGEAAAAVLRDQHPAARVDVWPLDMTSYASVQALVQRVDADLPRLDVVLLNAGVMRIRFGRCPETGHEETIQVNYLSTFLLAILLLPLCKARAPPGRPGRLTIVSSGTALMAKLANRDVRPLLPSFDAVCDDDDGRKWAPAERYFASKMLGHLFFVRLLDYLHADDVVVNLVEPGMCKGSSLHRDATGPASVFFHIMKGVCGRRPEDGAWTYVDAAVVKGKESHGCFLMDWEIHPFTKLVYEPEGKAIMDALWDETMAEYAFAGVRDILDRSKRRAL